MELDLNPVMLVEEMLSDEFGCVSDEFREGSDGLGCSALDLQGNPLELIKLSQGT